MPEAAKLRRRAKETTVLVIDDVQLREVFDGEERMQGFELGRGVYECGEEKLFLTLPAEAGGGLTNRRLNVLGDALTVYWPSQQLVLLV